MKRAGFRGLFPNSVIVPAFVVLAAACGDGSHAPPPPVERSPDLVFSYVRPTSLTVAAGDTAWLEWEVVNRGTAASAATTIGPFLSDDGTITPSDRWGEGHELPGVPPFERRTNVQPLVFATAGTYYVGMCVEPVAGESDIGNNCSDVAEATVTGSPDLVFSSVSPPLTVVAGDTAWVEWEVLNHGTAASAATTISPFLSDDATITPSDFGGDLALELDAIAPHGRLTNVQPWIFPVAGTYYVGMCVEPVAGESDVGNNCSDAVEVTVTGSPDLAFSYVGPTSLTVTVGDTARVEWEVVNQGTAASAATTATAFLSDDPTITPSDWLGWSREVPAMAPNERLSGVEVWIDNVTPGTYYVGNCVFPVAGEPDVENNCSDVVELTVVAASF